MSAMGNNNLEETSVAAEPDSLPGDIDSAMQQALKFEQFVKGFQWVLANMNEEMDPRELVIMFMDRFEQQVLKAHGNVLQEHKQSLRAGIVKRTLQALPRFRTQLAEVGFNFIFLETRLKELLLSAILHIPMPDVKAKVFLSGQKPPHYLEDEIQRLIPSTWLKTLL